VEGVPLNKWYITNAEKKVFTIILFSIMAIVFVGKRVWKMRGMPTISPQNNWFEKENAFAILQKWRLQVCSG
jgi:hypothetical protein